MMEPIPFKAVQLSAAQYVLALHQPEDRVAVLVRNRVREQTMQHILSAEDIASPPFQNWLKAQNDAGAGWRVAQLGEHLLCKHAFISPNSLLKNPAPLHL